MRLKFASIVAITVLLPLFLIWAGWGLWGIYRCGEDCLEYAVSGTVFAFVAAIIGGASAGLWSWFRFPTVQTLSPRVLGGMCAVALLPILFNASSIRALVSEHYFPYVISLRFGYTGFFSLFTLLSVVVCGAVVLVAGRWSNLTTRWSGP